VGWTISCATFDAPIAIGNTTRSAPHPSSFISVREFFAAAMLCVGIYGTGRDGDEHENEVPDRRRTIWEISDASEPTPQACSSTN
jgi:hypothetical protein